MRNHLKWEEEEEEEEKMKKRVHEEDLMEKVLRVRDEPVLSCLLRSFSLSSSFLNCLCYTETNKQTSNFIHIVYMNINVHNFYVQTIIAQNANS